MFEVIKEYPNMDCKLGDIIKIPSEKWKYADGTYCEADYFRNWKDIFKELN
mgnify:CR=1 FL=1